jgi:hypothetical protein
LFTIQQHISITNTRLNNIQNLLTRSSSVGIAPSIHALPPPVHAPSPSSSPHHEGRSPAASHVASHVSVSSAPLTLLPAGHFTSLILGDWTTIWFSESETPDPPAVSFAHDIPRLNGMWDDTTSHWGGSSVLVIQGRPIAITYWCNIYSYAKSKKNQWKGMKAKWFEWKVRLASLTWRTLHNPFAGCC